VLLDHIVGLRLLIVSIYANPLYILLAYICYIILALEKAAMGIMMLGMEYFRYINIISNTF